MPILRGMSTLKKTQGELGADREAKITNNEANSKKYGFIFQNASL